MNTWFTMPFVFDLGKKDNTQENKVNIQFSPKSMFGFDKEKTPLYVVDGIEVESMEHVKPEEIESIHVVKDKAALKLYGSKGENGVILITLKKQ